MSRDDGGSPLLKGVEEDLFGMLDSFDEGVGQDIFGMLDSFDEPNKDDLSGGPTLGSSAPASTIQYSKTISRPSSNTLTEKDRGVARSQSTNKRTSGSMGDIRNKTSAGNNGSSKLKQSSMPITVPSNNTQSNRPSTPPGSDKKKWPTVDHDDFDSMIDNHDQHFNNQRNNKENELNMGEEPTDKYRDLDKEFEEYKDENYISRLQRLADQNTNENEAIVTVLLPYGIVLSVKINSQTTFEEIKEKIFNDAKNYPLANELKDQSEYSFSYVNNNADLEELVEDSTVLMCLSCSRLLLKVSLRRGTKKEKLLNAKIGALIGKALLVYGNMNDREVDDFRRSICDVVSKAMLKIRSDPNGWENYIISPHTVSDPIPSHIAAKFSAKGSFLIHCYFVDQTNVQHNTMFKLPVFSTTQPLELIEKVLTKRAKISKNHLTPEEYILNIKGTREYIYGPHGMGEFVYIREILAKGHQLEVMLSEKALIVPEEPAPPTPMSYIPGPPMDLDETVDLTQNFQVRFLRGSNIATGTLSGLYVRANLVYGGQPICKQRKSGVVAAADTVQWNEMLTFDISLHDIPLEARLVITLYGVWFNANQGKDVQSETQQRLSIDSSGESQSRNTTTTALAWVNCNLFDFHGVMRAGQNTLHTWPCDPGDPYAAANPIGTVVPNPDRSCTPALTIEFMQNCIHEDAGEDEEDMVPDYDKEVSLSISAMDSLNKEDQERLKHIQNLDPLAAQRMDVATKEFVWKYRYYAPSRPELLPKLLLATRWNDSEAVREVHQLIHFCKPLKPEDALQLLDSNFADRRARQYAVRCLEPLSDYHLLQFLMQLVQVLKYEAFLDCALARFLLYRAVLSKRVGHYFFWYLRSEMYLPEVSVRFGLLLEAFARGNVLYMEDLRAQMDAMQELVHASNAIKKKQLNTKDKKLKALRDTLGSARLKPFRIPLNSSICVGSVIPEKCSFMDSKKMPLKLVFNNAEAGGDEFGIFFKSGDDLRQDMLTLQMIRIMDHLWQQEGLDLKMIPYACISTGDEQGMIEIVTESKTVWHIQDRSGGGVSGAFKDEVIYKWLVEVNNHENIDEVVENFTLSCAGYAVATCILGIGDRHNDNIMVKTSGQFFHIDFGHFLGNFKSKFGIKRERVPFVLTPDMVFVICGKKGRESEKFEKFKNLCKTAYTIIRRNANLFINLFAMMLSTGIPQLRSSADLEFLRTVLYLDGTEKEAVAMFDKMIHETLDGGWTTRINWAFHGMVH